MAQSLLLMTTVAMPVFSKKKETLSHGILLGVVGTDVPLLEVMMMAPRYKVQVYVCVNAYDNTSSDIGCAK